METLVRQWIERVGTKTMSVSEAQEIFRKTNAECHRVSRQGRDQAWKKRMDKAEKENMIANDNIPRAERARIAKVFPELALEFAKGNARALTQKERQTLAQY